MKKIVNAFFAAFWMGSAWLTQLSAQPEDIVSRHYSRKDGLTRGNALSILQDSQGFLWVGTHFGLNKFDGYRFTNYRENPSDSNSLANQDISCLWEDQQQRLWVGTSTGLELLDMRTEKFYHLVPDSLDPAQGIYFRVSQIRERKDGKIWLCTAQGVYLADPQTLSIRRNIHFPQDGDGNDFEDIAEARDGSLWVGSKRGLVHINMNTGETTRYRHDPADSHSLADDEVLAVHVDRHDRVWAGTNRGLDLFNPEDQSFTLFLPERLQAIQTLNHRLFMHALLEQPDGKLLVASGDGLYAFDPETGAFDLLVDKYIMRVYKDRQSILWWSSIGLSQIAPQRKKFTIYRQFGPTDVSNLNIHAQAEDANRQIWISTFNPSLKLFRYDPSSGHFHEFLHDSDDPYSYPGSGTSDIVSEPGGQVWLASYGKLIKFDPQIQTFSSIEIPNRLSAIFKDAQGKVWLGGHQGFGVYDLQTQTYEKIANLSRAHTILEDRVGNLWIGTRRGLFRYGRQTGQLDVFKHDSADPQSLPNDWILHMMKDQAGVIWLGTSGGLGKMISGTENAEPKFMHWRTTNSELPYDDVRSIVDGRDGTLWMSSGNQISHFFPQSGEFRNYDYRDGLPNEGVDGGLRSHNGKIYYGSAGGLVVFHPDSLRYNLYSPPVVITGLSIHNEPVPIQGSYEDTLSWETPLIQNISYTDALELTYQQNDFALEFAALNFVNPENNLYKYKLEPYEEEWIETTASNRTARYTNLNPGQYTFRVIGSNNDGIWNNEGKSLSIIIHPPWWQTWWAYTLYGLLALGILLSIRHYEIKRLKLRQRALHLAEVDTLKTRFFANISHEFRTPLTLILGPVKKLMENYHAPDIQNNLSGVQRNAQRLLHLVNQLLDLSKLEAGKLKLEAVKSDIVSFLKARAHAFSSLAEHKNIHFAVELPDEKIGAFFDGDKLEKIINNLLSNAFKFTQDGGSVNLKGQAVTQDKKEWF